MYSVNGSVNGYPLDGLGHPFPPFSHPHDALIDGCVAHRPAIHLKTSGALSPADRRRFTAEGTRDCKTSDIIVLCS